MNKRKNLDKKLQVDIVGLWGGPLRLLALTSGDQIDTLQKMVKREVRRERERDGGELVRV